MFGSSFKESAINGSIMVFMLSHNRRWSSRLMLALGRRGSNWNLVLVKRNRINDFGCGFFPNATLYEIGNRIHRLPCMILNHQTRLREPQVEMDRCWPHFLSCSCQRRIEPLKEQTWRGSQASVRSDIILGASLRFLSANGSDELLFHQANKRHCSDNIHCKFGANLDIVSKKCRPPTGPICKGTLADNSYMLTYICWTILPNC